MSRNEARLSRLWPIAVCLGAMFLAGCGGEEEEATLYPCEGRAMLGGSVKQQVATQHGLGPCLVIAYADSIGTDTTSAYRLDSIGTDTTTLAASTVSCVGRLVANGQVVSEDTAESGPCVVRFFMDSIGTDTTTTPARLIFRLDSIGTDTSATG
jgi:hypothetical protein